LKYNFYRRFSVICRIIYIKKLDTCIFEEEMNMVLNVLENSMLEAVMYQMKFIIFLESK